MSVLLPRPVSDKTALLVFENYALATRGAIAEGSSFAEGASCSHLLDSNPRSFWRSTQIGQSEKAFIVDIGKPRSVSWFSLHLHNVRVPWRVEMYAGDPQLEEAIHDTGWYDPIVGGSIGDSWETMQWASSLDYEMLDELSALNRLHSFIELETPVQARALRFRFDTTGGANGSSDHLLVSSPIIGNAWRPQTNMVRGWQKTADDLTSYSETEQGGEFGIARPVREGFQFSLDWLKRGPIDEGRELFRQWFRRFGTKAAVFAWPNPADLKSFYDDAKLYRLEQIPALVMAHETISKVSGFKLKEIL